MRIDFVKRTMGIAMAVMLIGFAPLGAAQDKPADNLQIENKIRAVVRYDLAQGVPLVK